MNGGQLPFEVLDSAVEQIYYSIERMMEDIRRMLWVVQDLDELFEEDFET